MAAPARFVNIEDARLRFGDRVDRLAPFLTRVDPLADAVVHELAEGRVRWATVEDALARGIARVPGAPAGVRALFEHVEHVPAWVDWGLVDRAGSLLFRAGPLGGMVLGTKSLVSGYAAPGGNKPLVFSGRLREHAARRLNETARFVQAVCRPGGLRPRADGYRISVKVRIMHARVRYMILRAGSKHGAGAPRWDAGRWGSPINQHDMAATMLLFSLLVVDGCRQLGMHVSRDEADEYVELWRYAGYLMGVDDELAVSSEAEGRRLGELIAATQGPPDQDSRDLTEALMNAGESQAATEKGRASARRRAKLVRAVSRALVGDAMADGLGLERSAWGLAVPVLQRAVRAADLVRARVPGSDRRAVERGARYWDRVVRLGLAGEIADFAPPERLAAG